MDGVKTETFLPNSKMMMLQINTIYPLFLREKDGEWAQMPHILSKEHFQGFSLRANALMIYHGRKLCSLFEEANSIVLI